MKFIRFIGNSALANNQVALYEIGAGFTLRAETVRGGKVMHDFETPMGKGRVVLTDIHLSKEDLGQLEDRWEAGTQEGSDARITQRALTHMEQVAVDRYTG